jgi:hypothetical protein
MWHCFAPKDVDLNPGYDGVSGRLDLNADGSPRDADILWRGRAGGNNGPWVALVWKQAIAGQPALRPTAAQASLNLNQKRDWDLVSNTIFDLGIEMETDDDFSRREDLVRRHRKVTKGGNAETIAFDPDFFLALVRGTKTLYLDARDSSGHSLVRQSLAPNELIAAADSADALSHRLDEMAKDYTHLCHLEEATDIIVSK